MVKEKACERLRERGSVGPVIWFGEGDWTRKNVPAKLLQAELNASEKRCFMLV